MGKVVMTCGHEAIGDESMEGYWWKDHDGSLSYGCLCQKCVPVYRAVRAETFEEATELLRDDPGVTLQDICASWEGASRETQVIDGVPFDIVKVPPTSR